MAIEHRYLLRIEGCEGDAVDVSSIGTRVENPAHDFSLRAPRPAEVGTLHDVYLDAFSTRTDAALDAATWIPKWPLHPLCSLELSILAFHGDAAAGYLLAYLDPELPGEGIIGQLGVRTAFRHQRLGTAMIVAALKGFGAQCLPVASLSVAPDNTYAVRLYRHLGFVRDDRYAV